MHLSFLRSLYDVPQPAGWASVYLDASHDTEDANRAIALRWRGARDDLRDQGADEPTLMALDTAIAEYPPLPGEQGLAAFAAAGRVRLTLNLPHPPRRQQATFTPLPHVTPAAVELGEQVRWLRVVVDRTAADLDGATSGAVDRLAMVSGSSKYPIHRAKPGGWSAPRYQRAAVENWQRNAEEIAKAAAELAERIGAEVIVLAGDPHARELLAHRLPVRWRERVVLAEGSRAPGADLEPLADATTIAIAEVAERRRLDALDRLRSQLGRDAAAGVGLPAVVAAIQRAQVDVGFLADDPGWTADVWIGPVPTEVATTADELRSAAVADPILVPADDAILRGLTATDAELVTTDVADLPSGVAALLRYADPATRHR
jgi:Bacterial archaeo-eukaryotic release factor family 2